MEITSIQGLAYWSSMAILVFVVVLAIVDENVAPWLGLQGKILLMECRKQWLLLKMKPDMWLMKWRMRRVLKRLEKENADIINGSNFNLPPDSRDG